ncbi:MAG: Zn-dependent hydrolase [Chloroflexota bacterium]
MTDNLRINGQRLWDTIMEMGKIGETAGGGSHRLALSDDDRTGRDLFKQWAEAAGCQVAVDELGNMFALRPGTNNDLPPIGMGSHLDTQPFGGKFDGVFGVLSGLEVMRALNDADVTTTHPLVIVNWTNEEGARFAPAMMASGVYADHFDKDWILARVAADDGATFGAELERIGYKGDLTIGDYEFAAFFEPHIEQGPILEAEEKSVGVVDTAQGFRWYDITFRGHAAHTGSTPMVGRRNALLGVAKVIQVVDEIAHKHAPYGRGTVGSQFHVGPGSRNIIPETVDFTVDMRHPDDDSLAAMDAALREVCETVTKEIGLEMDFEQISYTPPTIFDKSCVDAVQAAADLIGASNMTITSGAGHDACYVAKRYPTSMIFVPCKDGISHNESESAKQEDLEAGGNVLLHAVLKYDVANS